MTASIWAILGIGATTDRESIRRAYAKRLKLTNPEDDPDAFQRLRDAYEAAISRSKIETEADEASPALSNAAHLISTDETKPVALNARSEREFANLQQLLQAEQPPEERALASAFTALVTGALLDDLIAFAQMEGRIARLILEHQPRSDPLIKPAIKAFSWKREDSPTMSREAIAVLDREDDLQFWRLRTSPRHPDHTLYLGLTQRLPKWRRQMSVEINPLLAQRMRRFLDLIDRNHPSLSAHLDPTAEAWWRSFLSSPRVAGLTAPVAVPIALWCTVAVLLDRPQRAYWLIPAVWVGVPLLVALAWAGLVWGLLRPRLWWMAHRSWRATAWERLGSAPISWLGLGAAAVTPRAPIPIAASVALSLAAVWWALLTGKPDNRPGRLPWFLRLVLSHSPIAIWLGVVMFEASDAMTPAVIVATAAAFVVNIAAGGGMMNWYQVELSPVARSIALSACMLAGLASIWAIVAYATGLVPLSTLLAIVAPFALAVKPVTAWLSAARTNIWFRVSYFGMFLIAPLAASSGGSIVVSTSVWLLASSGLGLVLAVTQS